MSWYTKIYNRCKKKNASKRAIPKAAEATGDLIGNKIADKITSASKKSTKELPNDEKEVDVERATPKKRYISPEGKKNYWWIMVGITIQKWNIKK